MCHRHERPARGVVGLAQGLRIRDAFELFDHDGDGVLKCSELYGGITWLGLSLTPEAIQELFSKADVDSDGKVSMTEFKNVLDLGDGSEEHVFEPEDGAVPHEKIAPIAITK
eukprot:gene29622-36909_t